MRTLVTLGAMMSKELRVLLRERGQMAGLVFGLLAMVIGFGVPAYEVATQLDKFFPRAAPPAGESDPFSPSSQRLDPAVDAASADAGAIGSANPLDDPAVVATVRWLVIAAVAPLGLFTAIMFGTTLALAAFVGEREAETMEVLLMAPLSDKKLYVLKCLSVLIPGALITYLIVGVYEAVGMALIGPYLPDWLPGAILEATLWALPVPLLGVLIMSGLCVCASVRAETTKGAGQIVGMVIVAVMFGFVLVPLAMSLVLPESVKRAVADAMQGWLQSGFAWQYGSIVGTLSAVCLLLLWIGFMMFDREKLLT